MFNVYSFLVIFVALSQVCSQKFIDSSCTVETSGTPGKCKLITNCKQVRDEILTLQRLPEICSFQGTQAIVCCPLGKQPGDISKQKCKEYSSYAYEESSNEGKKYECEHKISKRIVGGEPVRRKEFPHMAALGFEESPGEISWLCGGSIISENYILTAAHCVTRRVAYSPKLVRVGVTTLNDTDHRQDLKVLQVIPHPDYRPLVYYNDIALLKVEKSIVFNSFVRPACLYLNRQISVEKAVATGWGHTEYAGTPSNDLLKVTLDMVDHGFCNLTFKRLISKRLMKGIIDDVHVCAGSFQKDACQGDAGGPLQIYHDGDEDIKCMYDIMGVSSFGKVCGLGHPSVYTRVSHYIEWIENTVWT